MKVVITCEGEGLEDRVDPRFGRCRTFMLVDTETLHVQAIPNEAAMLGGGAGIQAGQLVSQQGAEAIITGQLGPNAARVLGSTGISVYIGASGSARDALEAFKAGRLQKAEGATVEAHYGVGGGGMGMGRGMGMDPGMGMKEGGIEELKKINDDLQKRMDDIQKRVEELEKK